MSQHTLFTDGSDWGCDMHGRDLGRRNGITRRGFLRDGALALVGTSVVPAFLTRSIYARDGHRRRRRVRSWWWCFSAGRAMG